MTKQDLINQVAEVSGVDKKTVEHVLNVERDVMIEALKNGEEISTRGFGTFKIATRAARKARNLHTNEMIDVPEKKVLKFKAAFDVN